jgi:adenine-specific DNA-methyltransferase
MTFRYIGSKARVVDELFKRIDPPSGYVRFVDLFCGTGAVADAASRAGFAVHLNDHLASAVIMASARMTGPRALQFKKLGGYESAITALNSVKPKRGFIYREYSPASISHAGLERRYFTTDNASKIDAMRHQIASWAAINVISLAEERVLLADLLGAANRVANIAGTYGCFLSTWQKPALEAINLRPREAVTRSTEVTTSTLDAKDVPIYAEDVVYLDPPYTKRQYAAYYHLLETIALGDEPVVEGVSGLRPWRSKASDFCYKTRALNAMANLVREMPSRRILISYSDDAHIPIKDLIGTMRLFGKVKPVRLMEIGRYRPNAVALEGQASVHEYLIEVEKTEARVTA